ncbi:uncharacterized protein TRIVIDRAFT_216026 [Trichoderma virens Gv29-8]|uniref:Uncharacterized protein n=1 Tax=Hypocrea virens (strain Gv29-8 / FGSC 10586) TaxID=413071 RepID=G9MTU7_HYPVG|nr:uncharacterized protein TRIVIDRAFT_216026 [Trichoderma virens Gv29-8]EHK22446.1 hypothetical protein TRIVIDRAFT_216026 [Trichoderma virens Gv29-8]
MELNEPVACGAKPPDRLRRRVHDRVRLLVPAPSAAPRYASVSPRFQRHCLVLYDEMRHQPAALEIWGNCIIRKLSGCHLICRFYFSASC